MITLFPIIYLSIIINTNLLLIVFIKSRFHKRKKYHHIKEDEMIGIKYIKSNKCYGCLFYIERGNEYDINGFMFCYSCYREKYNSFKTISLH